MIFKVINRIIIFMACVLLPIMSQAACTITSMTPNTVAIDVTSTLSIYGTFSGDSDMIISCCAISDPLHCMIFGNTIKTPTVITKPTTTWMVPFAFSSYFPCIVHVADPFLDPVLSNCDAGSALNIKTPTLITVTPSTQTLTTPGVSEAQVTKFETSSNEASS